jgi:chromosome segregation ATPase
MIENMSTKYIAFNALNFIKRLVAAGMDPKIAETEAELHTETYEQISEQIAECKPAIIEFKTSKNDFAMKSDLVVTESTLKTDIAELRAELKTDIAEVRTEIAEVKTEIVRLECKIDNLQNTLTVKLGGMITASTVILGTIIAIFR